MSLSQCMYMHNVMHHVFALLQLFYISLSYNIATTFIENNNNGIAKQKLLQCVFISGYGIQTFKMLSFVKAESVMNYIHYM
jgi:hypothetical protein